MVAFNRLFYSIKPIIPRWVQLYLRRRIAQGKLKKHRDTWPINESTATAPQGWRGWPDGKQFALVLQHDVDTRKGHDNCRQLMTLEEKLSVRSNFNVVPERYTVSKELLHEIKQRGFGLGVHGLKHDGKLFLSYNDFKKNALKINAYLKEWGARGFSAPSMISKLEWMHHLKIEYSTSSFDTDPFEPQPVPVNTLFPFFVHDKNRNKSFVELPYTLPQDFTLFIILQEKSIAIWKNKLDWIAEHGGMALVNVHPDYLNFNTNRRCRREEYSAGLYNEFISYIKTNYAGRFWNALPEEIAAYMEKKNTKQIKNHTKRYRIAKKCTQTQRRMPVLC
jgi:hypothetical protein